MPLEKGSSHDVIAGNIKELIRTGTKPKQAIAMAVTEARLHKTSEPAAPIAEAAPAVPELTFEETHAATEASEPRGPRAVLSKPVNASEPSPELDAKSQIPDANGLTDSAKRAILARKAKRAYVQ